MSQKNNDALDLEKIGDKLSKKFKKEIEPKILQLNFTQLSNDFFEEDLTTINENDSKEFTLHHIEKLRGVIDKKDINYKLNKYNYRSDEFFIKHEKQHVLFMGCSETQGIGGNLEECWSYMLYEKLKYEFNLSGYFNIGIAGSSIIQQIMNYYKYELLFGKPKTIFLLVPDVFRGYMINSNNNYVKHSTAMFSEKMISEEIYFQFFINSILAIRQFELYCKSNNIKLLWSSWYQPESLMFNEFKFNNFFPMYSENISPEQMYEKYPEYRKYNDMSKDLHKRDMHNGVLFHRYWANMFLKRLKL
jgi:hypothetical protein